MFCAFDGNLTDLPPSQILRVEEDEESVTKCVDLCFQFLRLDEEEDPSIGPRTVDYPAMCAKHLLPALICRVNLSNTLVWTPAVLQIIIRRITMDRTNRGATIGTWGNETSQAVQIDGGNLTRQEVWMSLSFMALMFLILTRLVKFLSQMRH